MLSYEDRKYILNEFLRNISHISDKEYQKRVWIRGEGPECDDFDETSCYFHETMEAFSDEFKNFDISESQYQLLVQFRDELNDFDYGTRRINYLPQEFIDTPEWGKIMELAKEVLKAFNYQPK